MTQPDFGAGFHKDTWSPVRYRARPGSWGHDVVYLSSYLHDATLRREDLTIGPDGFIRVETTRDTWETYRAQDGLEAVRSTLTFGVVEDWTWRRCPPGRATAEPSQAVGPSGELQVRYIESWVRLDSDDLFRPVLRIWFQEDWQLELTLREPESGKTVVFGIEDTAALPSRDLP